MKPTRTPGWGTLIIVIFVIVALVIGATLGLQYGAQSSQPPGVIDQDAPTHYRLASTHI